MMSTIQRNLPASYLHLCDISRRMPELFINRLTKQRQYILTLIIVSVVSVVCFIFSNYLGYRVVAFILLVTVSLLAIVFDILPVFFGALLSALVWDFFFIPPRFTFHVDSTEDAILLVMYFIIAMINAVLTYKIRQVEKIARQREEKANAVKLYDTLLNSLSHELRTPIATIIGATDNLQNNADRLSEPNRKVLLDEISKASFRLNQQVSNLLNMSRLDSGFIQPRQDWCDVSEVVYAAVKRVEENQPSQKVDILVDITIPLFKIDKDMLEQIIYNLLHNATLYTMPDSEIKIYAGTSSNNLIVTVTDSGKGFQEDEIDKVFDKFYRAKYSRTGGTGLGLSIVKGFAEAMKGSVSLENTKEGGAKFTVIIPAEASYLKI